MRGFLLSAGPILLVVTLLGIMGTSAAVWSYHQLTPEDRQDTKGAFNLNVFLLVVYVLAALVAIAIIYGQFNSKVKTGLQQTQETLRSMAKPAKTASPLGEVDLGGRRWW